MTYRSPTSKAADCKGPHDMAKITFANWRIAPFYRCRTCALILETDEYTLYLTQEKGPATTASTEAQDGHLEFELPMMLEGEKPAVEPSVRLCEAFPDESLPWGFGF